SCGSCSSTRRPRTWASPRAGRWARSSTASPATRKRGSTSSGAPGRWASAKPCASATTRSATTAAASGSLPRMARRAILGDLYHLLLTASWPRLLGLLALAYVAANERGNNIAEAQVHVALARQEVTAEGESVRRFHDLELSRRLNPIFPNTWTVIHPITEVSPLHGATADSLATSEARIVVSVIGLDESYAQTVHSRHSYAWQDLVCNARFAGVSVCEPVGDVPSA